MHKAAFTQLSLIVFHLVMSCPTLASAEGDGARRANNCTLAQNITLVRELADVATIVNPANNSVVNRTLYCEESCAVPALDFLIRDERPEECEELCPEYCIEDEFLTPDAICTICPEDNCRSCLCMTGECLDYNTLPDGGTEKIAGGSSTRACSHCCPKSTCRIFWWCQNQNPRCRG